MAFDTLSKLASSSSSNKKRSAMVETLAERSIDNPPPTINTVSPSAEWYDDILAYKLVGTLPKDKMAAKKLKRDSPWYCIFQDQLYKKGFSLPLLWCNGLRGDKNNIGGNHIGGKTLALKALGAAFYWPTMLTDAHAYVKK